MFTFLKTTIKYALLIVEALILCGCASSITSSTLNSVHSEQVSTSNKKLGLQSGSQIDGSSINPTVGGQEFGSSTYKSKRQELRMKFPLPPGLPEPEPDEDQK